MKEKDSFRLEGYDVVRSDRLGEKTKGGVATLIRNGISYAKIGEIKDRIESIIIQVNCTNQKINIANVYCRPDQQQTEDDFIPCFELRNAVIVGDFNAHSVIFGSRTTNKRGQILEKLVEENEFVVLNTGTGTHINRSGSESSLDITMVRKNLGTNSNWEVIRNPMGSDHYPTLTTLNEHPSYEVCNTPKWIYRKADWATFKEQSRCKLSEDQIKINRIENVSVVYTRFVTTLVQIAEENIPKTTIKAGSKKVPYWDTNCQEAVNRRNKALNKMRQTKDLADCIEYRRLRGMAQRTIKDAKRASWRNYCGTINNNTKMGDIWRMTKKMSGVNSQRAIPNSSSQGQQYETNREKAQLFARTFARVSSDENHSHEFRKTKENFRPGEHQAEHTFIGQNEINEQFAYHELRQAVQQSKRNSSPGEDMISYEIIKELPKPSLLLLLRILNMTWTTSVLPAEWKHALIIPILKPAKPNDDPTSYRPISLTSTICKIMERMVANRLCWFLETNRLFNRNQSGFRRNRACIDQIMRIQDDIHKSIHNKGSTVGLFIDLEKAFDLIWREGLIHKMKRLGIQEEMLKWVSDFLSDRTIQVRVGTELSDIIQLENGTPQGSVLSPILFLIMMNDLPETEEGVKLSVFADDCCIWKAGSNTKHNARIIQKYTDRFQTWCDSWGFKISKTKTTAVVFTHKQKDQDVDLKIGDSKIQVKNSVKFLGVILDKKLSWNEHIQYVVDRCKSRINLLRALTGTDWGANKKTLLTLYRVLVRSVIDYGSIAYDSASEATKKKLDQIQSKALRICCGAICTTPVIALQVECGEIALSLRRKEMQLQYAAKLLSNEENPTRTIMDDCWQNYATYPRGRETFATKTGNIKEIIGENEKIIHNSYPEYSPCKMNSDIYTDVSLASTTSENREHSQQRAEEVIRQHEKNLRVFVDGAKTSDNKTGIAIRIPSLNYNARYRLSDKLSTFTIEAAAITTAIKHLADTEYKGEVTVFSDSLETLTSIGSNNSKTAP